MTKLPEVLFVSWQDEESRRIIPIARLLRIGGTYEFAYINAVEDAKHLGFAPLLSFPKFEGVYRSTVLPALFENRVMPRSREDFPAHVAEFALAVDQAEPFTVLARSGGKRMTDRLEVFSPPVVSGDSVEGVSRLALALRSSRREFLGYVPDYLAAEIGSEGASPAELQVTVVKVNPDPAPVHHRLLCRFEYPLDVGARLFSGHRYQPLSRNATTLAA